MMMFLTFKGESGEDASLFLNSLELAFLSCQRDDEATKIRNFPLVLQGDAQEWFVTLPIEDKGTWEDVRGAFLQRYGARETAERIWQ